MTTIERLQAAKQRESYHSLSKRLDVPVNTLYRWLKAGKIGNKVYEFYVAQKLGHLVK